jgi:Spy/CpxP family protein refolding chaperone
MKTTPLALTAAFLFAACGPGEYDPGTAEGALGEEPSQLAKLQRLMGKLALRADQRATLETMAKDLAPRLAPARKLRAEAVTEIARQVRAGKIDRARLEALLKRAEALHATLRPTVLVAVNNLHRTLDAGQRSKLLAALEKGHGRRGHRHGLRSLRKVAKQLQLTDDQLDRIQAAVKESWGGVGERLSVMLKLHDQIEDARKAFKEDTFNAADLEILKAVPGLVKTRVERAIRAAEKVLPILSAEQRALAAKLIEERAARKGGWHR